jgi:23S rRNA (cytosine1962-C5)-methyltransferase
MTQQKNKSPSTPHRPSQGNRDFRNRTKRSTQVADGQNTRGVAQAGEATAQPAILLRAGRENLYCAAIRGFFPVQSNA